MDFSLAFVLLALASLVLASFSGYLVSAYRTSRLFKRIVHVLEKNQSLPVMFEEIDLRAGGSAGSFLNALNQKLLLLKKEYESIVTANDQILVSNRIMEYSKQKFQEILNVTSDGILVLDPSGNVVLVNQAAENYLDIEAPNIVGKPIYKGIEYPDLKQLSGGSEKKYVDIRKERKEGGQVEKTLRFSLQPIRLSDPHSGQVMMIRDITEQIMADQARGEFIAHVSHELKTPLSTLKAYSEMLMDGEAGDEETKKEFYNTINAEADRLSGLIGNLLNITKIELGSLHIQKTRVKTGELLEDILDIAERQKKGKDISINPVLPDKLPVIKADKELLKVALLNLLSNAIKYTDEGKGISLKAEEDDGVFMIHVIDAGVGISSEDMPHVFEKFYRSKDKNIRQRPGHGLGLYLSRQIVQLHGGDIRAISHPGEGSQFTVILKIEEDILE